MFGMNVYSYLYFTNFLSHIQNSHLWQIDLNVDFRGLRNSVHNIVTAPISMTQTKKNVFFKY